MIAMYALLPCRSIKRHQHLPWVLQKLAVVEMPPYAGSSESVRWSTSIGLFTKLDASRDWFATTPVAILLKDGIVRAAIDGDRAGTPDPSWR